MVAANGNASAPGPFLAGNYARPGMASGFNQMALLEGKGPSARHEVFYFGGAELGAVRVDNFKYQFYDQPAGWPGPAPRSPWTCLISTTSGKTHWSARQS
jgi:hypothetical protein